MGKKAKRKAAAAKKKAAAAMTNTTEHDDSGNLVGSEPEIKTVTIGVQHLVAAVAVGAFLLLAAGLVFDLIPMPSIPEANASSSLWLIFLTGLSVGGLSCLAVQGGLLAAMIAQREPHGEQQATSTWSRSVPVIQFLVAKVLAYATLGAVLGYFGSKISLGMQGWLLVGAGIFMFIVVLQMLDAHPSVRRVSFRPPKSIERMIRRQSKRADASAPFILGALTIFIPCGVTLAMEAVAIASESALRGALIMTAFTLGTAPIFLLLGVAATELSASAKKVFRPLAMVMITVIAGVSIISGMRLLGFGGGLVTGETQVAEVIEAPVQVPAEGSAGASQGAPANEAAAPAAYQEATIDVVTGAFMPPIVQVKAGLPTRLNLVTENTRGCIRAFVIPELGIEKYLPGTGMETVEIPASDPGRIAFMCSMGMYNGVIEVVE